MKNLTKHFYQRWAERILEITDKETRQKYINENLEQIKEHANKTFEYAEFIFRGQIGDNITRNYYVKDDIVFVMNTTADATVTVYKTDFGFPSEINSQVRKGLIETIKKLTLELEEVEFGILEEVESEQERIRKMEDVIKLEELKIKNMKDELKFKKEALKQTKKKDSNLRIEIEKYTGMIVNSKEYREDLKNIS
jgi:hypothetical protein